MAKANQDPTAAKPATKLAAKSAAKSSKRPREPAPTPEFQRGTSRIASTERGRARAVIDAVLPAVDGGRFPIKRIAGEPVRIEAHCLTDGHDKLRVMLQWQAIDEGEVHEIDMAAQVNDVWLAQFTPPVPGRYRYTVSAWVDHLESWRHELERRNEIADIRVALLAGAHLIDQVAARAEGRDASVLFEWAAKLRKAADAEYAKIDDAKPGDAKTVVNSMQAIGLDAVLAHVAGRYADRSLAVSTRLELVADRKRAEYSTWYEMFPRSAAAQPARHGTFRDVEARLPYVAEMGFDVLYFPPIHPIGRISRKGKNNVLNPQPDGVGSPWAIGSDEGGHKAIHPQLGRFEDFQSLLKKAQEHGIEIALDIAFQCAPDHPYVRSHPQWFKTRPDGLVQYAENPPKKYQDIYPFDFESEDWRALWEELKSIFDFWIAQGVKIFRVDNPHTKSFGFWEWVIGEIKRAQPEVIFLAEAFTRPKVMHRLAKVGFSQSYTYFTWRNTKYELTQYFTELAHGPGRDYYRPNVWPNTPDILHETLQSGSRSVFAARLILAATLSANFGIYGPSFELLENLPREPGSEEYLNSEKYELRHWDLDRPHSLRFLIARLNRIRKESPALQSNDGLEFCDIDNDLLIAYLKSDTAGNVILTIVNLDPHHAQSGWVQLDLDALSLDAEQSYQVHDLLSDQRFLWRGRYNYVRLEPHRSPAHVFQLRRRVRSEQDFDYFI